MANKDFREAVVPIVQQGGGQVEEGHDDSSPVEITITAGQYRKICKAARLADSDADDVHALDVILKWAKNSYQLEIGGDGMKSAFGRVSALLNRMRQANGMGS